MEYWQQLPSLLLLLLLMCSRLCSAVPGLYSIMKREDEYMETQPQADVTKDQHSESIIIHQLQKEVEKLSRDLTDTRQALELLRAELDTKIREVKATPVTQEMTCRTDFTWWHETVGRSLEYLDNFDIHCRHGEFLRQWRMTWGERDRKKAIRYVCCHFKNVSTSTPSFSQR